MINRQKPDPVAGRHPEFMVRVKLPDSSGYAACPSGDSEYEDAYHSALAAATPPGFEVVKPRIGQRWPVDSEGYTFVPLRCPGERESLAHYVAEVKRLEAVVANVKAAVRGTG